MNNTHFDTIDDALSAAAVAEKSGELHKAAAIYAGVVNATPNDPISLREFAQLLHDIGQFRDALHYAKLAAALDPNDAANLHTYAVMLATFDQFDEAIALFRRALTIEPFAGGVEVGLHTALMAVGRYKEGWNLHSHRRWGNAKVARHHTPESFKCPKAGKTLFVWHDAGHGDSILMARYFSWLSDRGVKVIYESAPGLVPLYATHPGLIRVHQRSPFYSIPYEFDSHVSDMNLALMYGNTTGDWEPYCPGTYINALAPLIGDDRTVGICWHGSAATKHDKFRSMNAENGAKLKAAFKGYTRVALTPDENPALVSFADTANTIAACKVVVTTDTSVYHLAGAMGKPTVLLLSGVPDWRGRAVDGVSVFYPSVYVIRKPIGDKWDAYIDTAVEMAEKLILL